MWEMPDEVVSFYVSLCIHLSLSLSHLSLSLSLFRSLHCLADANIFPYIAASMIQ